MGHSRNAPCSCGSGKKYKRCCGNIINFPKSTPHDDRIRTASEMSDLAQQHLSRKNFRSLDEMNQELQSFFHKQNRRVISAFLGLTPEQMRNILYKPFSLQNEVFQFECADRSRLKSIPLVAQTLFFLKRLEEAGGLKATQKGNLPRALVVDLYQTFFRQERYALRPNKEDDLPAARRLRELLKLAGYMKKSNNKFLLTKKGKTIIEGDHHEQIFKELFLNFVNKWNWSYGDYFSELPLIQASAGFNLLLLHKHAQDWTLDEDLGQHYLSAFPALVDQTDDYLDPDWEVVRSFVHRFLKRTCLPCNLLEEREEGNGFDRKIFYRVSPFFRESFRFNV